MPSSEPVNPARVTLAVLAGGAGTRMGLPKALLRVGDEPILRWLVGRIAWPGPTLLVTAPSIARPPGGDAFNATAVDAVDGNGPLQGVLTALQHAPTPTVVITTVDMPNVTGPVLQWLVDRLADDPSRSAVMGRRGDGGGNANASDDIEPFPSAWRPAAIPLIEARLAAARRSVHGLLGPAVAAVPTPLEWDERLWLNVNVPADFTTFLATLQQ